MRWLTAGVVLGIGLGAFVDGIVLHQIAQWHNMGSTILPPRTIDTMKQNMVWDGLFHLAAWVITLMGVFMLRSQTGTAARQPASGLVGELFVGWGAFNLVEGLIDHHLLNLHHVRDMPVHVPVYDWLFLGIGGFGFLIVGFVLRRPVRRHVAA